MVSEDMSIPQEAHLDMAMSSQSSDDNEYLNDEELRSSFFIPGITGRARCLRDIEPLQLSSSSLMTRAGRDEKKKKKKISSDKDKKKRSSRHEVSIQELELYESFATGKTNDEKSRSYSMRPVYDLHISRTEDSPQTHY
jgi:hypothetical protein